MKKVILVAAVIIAAGFSSTVSAQTGTDAKTATVSATIVTPLALVKDADLKFGSIASTGAGKITVPAGAGAITANDGNNVVLAANPGNPAAFTVTGEDGATFNINCPSEITVTNGTGKTMKVDNFTYSVAKASVLISGATPFSMGADLNITAGQEGGEYTNTTDFTVTVAYN